MFDLFSLMSDRGSDRENGNVGNKIRKGKIFDNKNIKIKNKIILVNIFSSVFIDKLSKLGFVIGKINNNLIELTGTDEQFNLLSKDSNIRNIFDGRQEQKEQTNFLLSSFDQSSEPEFALDDEKVGDKNKKLSKISELTSDVFTIATLAASGGGDKTIKNFSFVGLPNSGGYDPYGPDPNINYRTNRSCIFFHKRKRRMIRKKIIGS